VSVEQARFPDNKPDEEMMNRNTLLGALAVGAVCWMTGCAGFFSDPNTTTSTSGSTTGDYIYVANQTSNTVAGFAVGTGTLTAVASTGYALTASLAPNAVVVNRQNGLVYVGGAGAIQCFSIGSAGVLTAVTTGGITVTGTVESMATSPDGQWLLALIELGGGTTATAEVAVYGINTSTGLLTQTGQIAAITFSSTIGPVTPKLIRISAAGNYAAAALGTAGDAFFTFTTSNGGLTQVANVKPSVDGAGNILSDNTLTFDLTGTHLFIGTTGVGTGTSFIQTYPISSGVLGTGVSIVSGDSPASLEIDSTGAYLYSANRGSSNISGYTYTNGTLTAMSTSPFGASSGIGALVRDKSGNYIVGVASTNGTAGTYDVTLYGFDAFTAGRLDEVAVAAAGTDPAGSVAVAATH
jgi:6-phosphogluconolactonase (cycloisomerase 2 family)